jgi:quercetin dioxygenase-like cupin family protein
MSDLGYFGNIWVRQNYLAKAGDVFDGHTHDFDHVSLLTQGKVRVTVKGFKPKEFTAPTFIVIKKQYEHEFVALEDKTNWYCVFALRDANGEVTDIYAAENSPVDDQNIGNLNKLEGM